MSERSRAWLLTCGHKLELNRWQEALTDRDEIPDLARCNFCGREGRVKHIVDAPGHGEYKRADYVQILRTPQGAWRWERRGESHGELVDASIDFRFERDAVLDAGAANRDFDRR